MSAIDFLDQVCPSSYLCSVVLLAHLRTFFVYFGKCWSTPHSSVYCHKHPTCWTLVSFPLATYTLVIKQQVCVVTEVKQLFSNLIRQLDSDFFPQSPGWQTHSLKPSNWLLWGLLRGNMLPSGQQHTLFKELCLSLFWVSSPQLCLLPSFHGYEKIYSSLK